MVTIQISVQTQIYLAKFLSPTKNYTNRNLNSTVKRTSRENLMFGTQKEKSKPNQTQTEKPQKDEGKAEESHHSAGQRPGAQHATQLLAPERLASIEAVTNQMEKEAVVARERAGFEVSKPSALHRPAPQKH